MNNINVRRFPRGGVLSDKDIREMVEKFPDFITVNGRKIDFKDKEKDSLNPAGVDLTIGRIYAHKEKQLEEKNEKGQMLRLLPGGFAHIESRERFNMPDNVIGFLIPRNSYSERGLLMLNAGHVDPGWRSGYLTLEVINLRDEPIDLTVGEDRPFSISFQYLHSSTTIPSPVEEDEIRRHRARGRLALSPQTLFSHYRERIIDDAKALFPEKREMWNWKAIIVALIIVTITMFLAALGAFSAGAAIWNWIIN